MGTYVNLSAVPSVEHCDLQLHSQAMPPAILTGAPQAAKPLSSIKLLSWDNCTSNLQEDDNIHNSAMATL